MLSYLCCHVLWAVPFCFPHVRDCCHAGCPFGLRLTDPSPDDRQKLVGMQAGAADEGAVHAGLAKQRGGVLRLDAAAVLYDKRLADFSSNI